MTPILALEVATPLLALVAILAIAWARWQGTQLRRKGRQLQVRIEAELDRIRAKSQRVRQRISLIAEVYCHGNERKKVELTRGLDALMLRMHQVSNELHGLADRLSIGRHRELHALHQRLVDLAGGVTDLNLDLDESDRMWSRELAGLNGTKVERSAASILPAATPA